MYYTKIEVRRCDNSHQKIKAYFCTAELVCGKKNCIKNLACSRIQRNLAFLFHFPLCEGLIFVDGFWCACMQTAGRQLSQQLRI
jgi:hypothetical protein